MRHRDFGYGYYPGGDPRKFSPDPECSTDEERARWKAACEAWNRGETPDPGGPHIPIGSPLPAGAEPVLANLSMGHVTVAHYGLGSYEMEYECGDDPDCWECGPRIRRAPQTNGYRKQRRRLGYHAFPSRTCKKRLQVAPRETIIELIDARISDLKRGTEAATRLRDAFPSRRKR
jgi:hypothetical protein